jgi:hypothetical protein
LINRQVASAALVIGGLAVSWLAPYELVAQVTVEKVSCLDLPNCFRLSNGEIEIVVTTDIGPRIIRYAFVGRENILGELGGSIEKKAEWQAWGGHRLWIAPEDRQKSYGPDNSPIAHGMEGPRAIRLTQPTEPATGIQKEMLVTLDDKGTGVTILHRLVNRGKAPYQLAPWALTIMNGGGTAIIPQEPYKRHEDALLPARALILWHYTDLSDARFAIGPKFIRLSTDAAQKEPQKIGVMNKAGWTAYAREGTVFVKRYEWTDGATYPDYGANVEVYTQAAFIEVESLGAMRTLAPEQSTEHTERWFLVKGVTTGKTEGEVEQALKPVLSQVR